LLLLSISGFTHPDQLLLACNKLLGNSNVLLKFDEYPELEEAPDTIETLEKLIAAAVETWHTIGDQIQILNRH